MGTHYLGMNNNLDLHYCKLDCRSTKLRRTTLLERPAASLVDGGGLRTFLCDPMHTLRSSGYTLSGISHIQIHRFRPVCIPSQKKSCFSRLFDSHPPDYAAEYKNGSMSNLGAAIGIRGYFG